MHQANGNLRIILVVLHVEELHGQWSFPRSISFAVNSPLAFFTMTGCFIAQLSSSVFIMNNLARGIL